MNPVSLSTYTIFGISMRRRSSRRKLVVSTYLVLAGISAVVYFCALSSFGAYAWGIYAALGVGYFIFGGTGNQGLVKAFANKPPRTGPDPVERIVFPQPVLLNLAPQPVPRQPTAWQNDERELARRDHAHYLAYCVVSLPSLFIMMLAAFAVPAHHFLSPTLVLRLIFLIALLTTILTLTLPSAIILWQEPDMPQPDDRNFPFAVTSPKQAHP